MTTPPPPPSAGAGVSAEAGRPALSKVEDPEIHKPITELGMVKDVAIAADGTVRVAVWLTVAGCPMRETITNRVRAAVSAVAGVRAVEGELDVMSDDQCTETRKSLSGGPTRS